MTDVIPPHCAPWSEMGSTHDALAAFLAGLEAEFGPADPALVEEFSQALR